MQLAIPGEPGVPASVHEDPTVPLDAEKSTVPDGGVERPIPASATWAAHVEPDEFTTMLHTTDVNVGFFSAGAPPDEPSVITYSAFGAIT